MNRSSRLISLVLALLLAASLAFGAEAPPNLVIEGVPPIPPELRTQVEPYLNLGGASFRNGQYLLHYFSLFDRDLPIPILHGPGKIEVLPLLRHGDLRLRLREFGPLKLGVLLIDDEAAQKMERSAEVESLRMIAGQ